MDNNIVTKKPCTAKSRCDRARECDYCARRRQQRIADKAEQLERQCGQLSMTVLVPEQNTEAAIRALHAKFMRNCLAPAGIWTVETGTQFKGLHLNIISPKPMPARWKNCETYSELLRTTARDAAAYIAKRSGMPMPEQYRGNLDGAFGIRKIGEIMARPEMPVVVQAAAIESVLRGGEKMRHDQRPEEIEYRTAAEEAEGWTEGAPVNGRRVWWSNADATRYTWKHQRQELSKEQRAEIMRRHLPNIYAAVGKCKNLTVV